MKLSAVEECGNNSPYTRDELYSYIQNSWTLTVLNFIFIWHTFRKFRSALESCNSWFASVQPRGWGWLNVWGIPWPLREACFRERPQTAWEPTVWETSHWTGPDRCYERVVLSAFFRILNQHPNWQKNELSLTLCRPIGDSLCSFPWSGNHYTREIDMLPGRNLNNDF